MKRMILISLALASSIAASLAFAQPASVSRPDPEAHIRNLSVLLELSPQQQTQLRGMLEAKREELKAQREAGRKAREHMREERRENRHAFEQQIAAILNAEQQAKFEAIKAERLAQREKRQAMRGGRRTEG